MDLNRFTQKAQQAVLDAQELARGYYHSEISPEHLLLALLNQTDGVAPEIVAQIGTRPELDEIILFHNLTREDIKQIVDIQWLRLEKLLAGRRLSITLSDQARDHLAEVGYDPVYGARPLKRAIQHELVDGLALAMLDGAVQEGDHIVVDVSEEGSSLTFYPVMQGDEGQRSGNIIEAENTQSPYGGCHFLGEKNKFLA